jgi:heat-inducible transcriptional repressor
MITERQEKLLNFLIKEYLTTAEPVSSKALKKSAHLDCCAATIRNDLQDLTEAGYIEQPHTSAGRVPTKKAYKYFAQKIAGRPALTVESEIFYCNFIFEEIDEAKREIESQMKMLEEISRALSISSMPGEKTFFEILNIIDTWHKKTKN